MKVAKSDIDLLKVEGDARQAGMPVGPLTIHDEVGQELTRKAGGTNQEVDEARGELFV